MLAFVRSLFGKIPHERSRLQLSEWAEQKRVIPEGQSSRPGPWHWRVVPYMREIADCLSKSSSVREIALMKGARVGYTAALIENHIGYMIDTCPGSAMLVSATKEGAQRMAEIRVDSMIENAGLSGKVFSQSRRKATKKTGNTKSKKEYPGGYLLIGGPTGDFLRSTGAKYLYLDEIDGWPLQIGAKDKKKGVTPDEGDPIKLVRRRAAEYEDRKVLYGSTPLVEGTSKIKKLFEEGDKSYYYVPCSKCGTMQILRWQDDSREGEDRYRIKFTADEDDRLVPGSVYYECENTECRHHWKNADKDTFLELGEWRPSAIPKTPNMRSFHLSSLYSPVQSWDDVCREWLKSKNDPGGLKTFINTWLGETWKEKSTTPTIARAESHRESYSVGTLPSSARPLILTAGADVQEDRVAVEVVAWGRGMESWSICYHEFPGKTDDIDAESWRALKQLLQEEHAGHPIDYAFIDAHYRSTIVHPFVEENFSDHVRACLGYPDLGGGRQLYRFANTRLAPRERVDLNVSVLKEQVYQDLSRGSPKGGVPDKPFPGYCHFPSEYSRKYFHMLTAEDRISVSTTTGQAMYQWVAHGANEALDCRVYALGCIVMARGERAREIAEEDPDAPPYEWSDFWTEWEGRGLAK